LVYLVSGFKHLNVSKVNWELYYGLLLGLISVPVCITKETEKTSSECTLVTENKSAETEKKYNS
jgi:hypothetical protein